MARNETASITLRILAQDLASGKLGTLVGHMDTMAKKGGLMGSIFQGVGQSFGQMLNPAMLAARAFGAVTDFMGDAISKASDLRESQSKVDEVFGDSADVIHDWSGELIEDFGLTTRAAEESAGTFGNFFQALGTGREDALDMSKGLVELGADLAAFNNIDVSDVLVSLRSGIAGEAEPMRRLGADVSAARVEAILLANGLTKVNGKFTEGQKVLGRYQAIMEDTTTAQGNFKTTSGDLAGQQKILEASLEEVTTQLGEQLLPKVLEVVKVINDNLIPTLDLLHDVAVGIFDDPRFSQEFVVVGKNVMLAGTAVNHVAEALYGMGRAGKTSATPAMIGAAEAARLLAEEEAAAEAAAKALDAALKTVADSGFKDVKESANETRKALRDAFKAPDSMKVLLRQQRELTRAQDRAARQGNENAFARASLELEANADAIAAEKAIRKEIQAHLANKGAIKAAKEETKRAKTAAQELAEVWGGPWKLYLNVDQTQLDATIAKVNALAANPLLTHAIGLGSDDRPRSVTPRSGTAPRPGGWDGNPNTPWPRAHGGPVGRGGTYLVGERGPEVLVMGGQSGNITPNDKLGGMTFVYAPTHSSASPAEAQRFAQAIAPALSREFARIAR